MNIKDENEILLKKTIRVEPDIIKFIESQKIDFSSYVRYILRSVKRGQLLKIPDDDFELILNVYKQDSKQFLADALSNQLTLVINKLNNDNF